VLCVGEALDIREDGDHDEWVRRQLRSASTDSTSDSPNWSRSLRADLGDRHRSHADVAQVHAMMTHVRRC